MATAVFENELRERLPKAFDAVQERSGLSWYQIAARIGITSQRLWDYRAGQRTMPKRELLELARLAIEFENFESVVEGLLDGWDSDGHSSSSRSSPEEAELSAFLGRRSPRTISRS